MKMMNFFLSIQRRIRSDSYRSYKRLIVHDATLDSRLPDVKTDVGLHIRTKLYCLPLRVFNLLFEEGKYIPCLDFSTAE